MSRMWIVFYTISFFLFVASVTIANIVYTTNMAGKPLDESKAILETIQTFLLCIGGSGVVLSTYFTAVNAFSQRASDKIENTFKLLKDWDDPHLFEARKLTRRIKDKVEEISDKDLIHEINNDEELKNSVILVLNYFEHVRFSFKTKRIDEDLFKKTLGMTILNIIDRFAPFTKKQSIEVDEDLKELKKLLEST